MMVLTKRCNQQCKYCHASSVSEGLDMYEETIRKSIDVILQSPSPAIKIEFQGGEPTLNFKGLRLAVEYATEKNQDIGKHLEFVVCTNLHSLDTEHIEFYKAHRIQISTSLDGPEFIHNACRVTHEGNPTYNKVVENIKILQEELGQDSVSALMTVTKKSIAHLEHVVVEYVRLGIQAVFIRSLNPFGFASSNWNEIGYSSEEFVEAYERVLKYIIEINRSGTYFPEIFASILLSRILTPYSTGFVDLQSPAGVGIQGVIYDTNGDVLVSDEARMYRNMSGDNYFKMGNVLKDDWKEIFGSKRLREIIGKTVIETNPGCEWCAYHPYCGIDPIKNYALEGDIIGFIPTNDSCYRMKKIFEILFNYLKNGSPEEIDILWSWATKRTVDAS
jgi:His-Xaa-Ser system radical SAM maturase HxsB